MSTGARVFVARLISLAVFDPLGDQVGRVRDVVVSYSATRRALRALGIVVEVPGRRRVFVPMTRVTSIEGGQVITTGLVNMRRFEQRPSETLVAAELFDRRVHVRPDEATEAADEYDATIEDVALEAQRNRDWLVTKVFVRRLPDSTAQSSSALGRGLRSVGLRRRRGETLVIDAHEITAGLLPGTSTAQEGAQGTARLLETYDELKPADLADALHELTPKRRGEVAEALDDDKLADVLEELPDAEAVEILTALETERAADILEAMEPDDAADLLSDLPGETAEQLLQLMEPDEAAPLRRLLTYEENTAGGLMTPEPVILGPETTIAEALAVVRREELSPALASVVYVARPPLETPTGRFLGVVHIQRLLREPPHEAIGGVLDKDVEPVDTEAPLGQVTRLLATYNNTSVPVVDDDGRLLGAVTVDDVLDHILPEDWREDRDALDTLQEVSDAAL